MKPRKKKPAKKAKQDIFITMHIDMCDARKAIAAVRKEMENLARMMPRLRL